MTVKCQHTFCSQLHAVFLVLLLMPTSLLGKLQQVSRERRNINTVFESVLFLLFFNVCMQFLYIKKSRRDCKRYIFEVIFPYCFCIFWNVLVWFKVSYTVSLFKDSLYKTNTVHANQTKWPIPVSIETGKLSKAEICTHQL